MNEVRIAVAGAGMIGAAHMARAQASPTCSLVAVVDPAPAAGKVAAQAGVPLYPTLDALFAAVEGRRRGRRLAEPVSRRAGAAVHRRRGGRAAGEAGGRHGRRSRAARRGGRGEERARDRRPSPRAQPDHGAGEGADRRGPARPHRRGHGQRGVLQARPLLRGRAVAPGAGRRPDPDQHDPRGAQPADAVRRDRRGAGGRVERGAGLRSRGHRGDQPALRQRSPGHVHALRHRRLPPQLGADVAGERGLRELSPTRTAT